MVGFLSGEASAGSLGDAPPEDGEDWEITQYTFVWDEVISINDLILAETSGGLKLKNVTLYAEGDIEFADNVEMIDTNITYNKQSMSDSMWVYKQLSIENTTIGINSSVDHVFNGTGEGIIFGTESHFVSTDNSMIYSLNWNISQPWHTSLELWSWGSDFNVNIQNSTFKHIAVIRSPGDDTTVIGNTFDLCRVTVYTTGTGFIYKDNYIHKGWPLAGHYSIYIEQMDEGIISNNTFNFTYDTIGVHSSGNITIENNNFLNNNQLTMDGTVGYGWSIYGQQSDNITIRENYYSNHSGSGVVFYRTNNSLIENNHFENIYGPDNIWVSGINNIINNNFFDGCGAQIGVPQNYDESSCIEVDDKAYSSFNVEISGKNWITNNTLLNYTENGIIVSGFSDVVVENNLIINGTTFGLTLGGIQNEPGAILVTSNINSEAPSDIKFYNNTINGGVSGIKLYGLGLHTGENIIIENNKIYNTTRGIFVLGNDNNCYSELLIENNILLDNEYSVYSTETYKIKIGNNTISGNQGVYLGDSASALLHYNFINSQNYGLVFNSTEAVVSFNDIISTCFQDSCLEIGFTKIGDVGISAITNSNIKIIKNNISKYNRLINIENSDFETENNGLDFTNYGIYSSHSNLYTENDIISNSTTGIKLISSILDSSDLSITNFEKGIHSLNSSFEVDSSLYSGGNICYYLVDSTSSIDSFNGIECNDAYLYEYYNVRLHISNMQNEPSSMHQYRFKDSKSDEFTYGQTTFNGFSSYHEILNKKIDNSGLETSFNPYLFYYEHNEITNVIEREINSNQTIIAKLDTVPPQSLIFCNSTLLNTEIIYLNFNIIDDSNDIKEFDIEFLKNDGIHFTEWEYYGTFNQSIVEFSGMDDTKYRFRSIAKDIYGNTEIKNGYDYEVRIDSSSPKSNFKDLEQSYYFTSVDLLLLAWESEDSDIEKYTIVVEYTNFTNEYLDPNSVIWETLDIYYLYDTSPFVYPLNSLGHYSFTVIATDKAGNIEIKSESDFIVNYDSSSDDIEFIDVPSRWGTSEIILDYVKSNQYLDFDLYVAIESVDLDNEGLLWFLYNEEINPYQITLSGLQDSSRYYLVAKSIDLAGNLEDPLTTTEVFSSNGENHQVYNLKYIPVVKNSYPLFVSVDEDFDGIYDRELVRGYNLSNLQNNQYYLDNVTHQLIFSGLANGGYVPQLGTNNIEIHYTGVHAVFEVYTFDPMPAQNLDIKPTNASHVIFSFDIMEDVDTCKVQRTTNISKGWFNEMIISPCPADYYRYEEINPDPDSNYYYRVYSEDEFGHYSYSGEKVLVMEDVLDLYSSTGTNVEEQFGMKEILPAAIILSVVFLLFGGVLLYRTKNNQELDENVNTIESKPVAKYKIEELYLIYSDGRLVTHISDVESNVDTDIMSGMLTAMNDFVKDSFTSKEDLGSMDYGQNKVLLQRGKNYYMAAVVYGKVDRFIKGKLANILRKIATASPHLDNWDGDTSQNAPIEGIIRPLLEETQSVTREMVDNYIADIQVSITSKNTVHQDSVVMDINISNYSTNDLSTGTIKPLFNSQILNLSGMKPDILYSFTENKFHIGEVKSYTEVQLSLTLKKKASALTTVDLEFSYFVGSKINTTTKRIFEDKI